MNTIRSGLLVLLSLLVFHCFHSNDDKKSPGVITTSITDTSTVTSRTQNSITTSDTEGECNNGVYSEQTVETTTFFEISDGQLLTWQENDCVKIIYLGDSPEVNGTWTTTFDTVSANNPNCEEGDFEEYIQYVNNGTGTLIVTDTTALFDATGELCMAELIADQVDEEEIAGGEEGIDSIANLTVHGCSQLTYDMYMLGSAIPVSASFIDLNADEMSTTSTIGNCTVTRTIPKGEPTAATCTNEMDPFEDSTMANCVMLYLMNNTCLADGFIEELSSDPGAPEFTKLDCNTIQADITYFTTTITYLIKYEDVSGVVHLTSTATNPESGQSCTYTQPLATESDPPDEFQQCFENLIGGGQLLKKSGDFFSINIPVFQQIFSSIEFTGNLSAPGNYNGRFLKKIQLAE